jgi:O-phosphoseryl-tRNA synthetase
MRGKEHPVVALTIRMRDAFLNLGFTEVVNPMIVDEREIYLQYGKEAPLILDRVYYLAGLDRAEIGLSARKREKIEGIIPGFFRWEELKRVLREYKEGEIESDEFIEVLTKRLKISLHQAMRLVDEVFSELSALLPICSKKTLRSHMTSAWYQTLKSLCKRSPLPIKLFSIGPRFRREQRQTPSHLFESTSASCVIADDSFSIEDGERLALQILKEIGFTECFFRRKEITSNYYEEGTDTEVFVKYGKREIEVANCGFYSEESLKNYEIEHRVFNLGFGIERIAGILAEKEDLRELVWPQFAEIRFSDEEIADALSPERVPASEEIKEMADELFEKIRRERDVKGPVEILIFDREVLGRRVKIWVYNWDRDKRLLSFAAFNQIWVKDGEIFGLPQDRNSVPREALPIYENGIKRELIFLKLILYGFLTELESYIKDGRCCLDKRIKMAKRPSEINLLIPDHIYNYITSNNKRVLVGGPLFFGLRAEIL